ncbi:MAG: non-oxidative hydroxyarylic acid decarboxylases subunit D [Pseudomonadota bacterium]|nr:non-oxidative hydroxyarylic acid decarboxylases subunit D [Pseudomonadota bacterium]
MNSCPRCTKSNLRVERTGEEQGKTLWTLYYCLTCNYSFRDTETPNVLDAAQRKAIFQVDVDHLDKYKPMLPGMA